MTGTPQTAMQPEAQKAQATLLFVDDEPNLLSVSADTPSTTDAIKRGRIYRYIPKPWEDHDMILLVRQALERKELEQEKKRLDALTQREKEGLKETTQRL